MGCLKGMEMGGGVEIRCVCVLGDVFGLFRIYG